MPISTVIRKKRKELKLTQEQIATLLGVSTPAVNKWENGATYPDFSLLLPLARILNVDLNTLLCFKETLTANEISQFSMQVMNCIKTEGFIPGFQMADEIIKQYPNCFSLIETLAVLLEGSLFLSETPIENKTFYEDQLFLFYQRAASGGDEQVRNKALYILISKYIKKEDYKKAEQLLEHLPEPSQLDKSQLQATLLQSQNKLEESAQLLERKLLLDINQLQTTILNLLDVELKMKNTKKTEKLSNGLKELVHQFDLWDFNGCIAPLEIAVKENDVEKSLFNLNEMLQSLLKPWSLKDSILYNHLHLHTIHKEDNQDSNGLTLLPSILLDLETNSDYDFLRSNKEFLQLIEKYQTICDNATTN